MCPSNLTSLFYPLSSSDTIKVINIANNSEKQIKTKM